MNVAAFFMKLWMSSKSLKMMCEEEKRHDVNSQILTLSQDVHNTIMIKQ
jgi:hypothetical protein